MSDGITKQDLDDVAAKLIGFLEPRFQHIEEELANTAKKDALERLTDTIDAFMKRLDDQEKENFARDAQLARLERWIETIAKQTGVKLEY